MRIQSINNINSAYNYAYTSNSKIKEQNPNQTTNPEILLRDITHNSSLINFCAKKTPLNPKYSLDEKLTSIFVNNFFEGDAILIGRNFDQVTSGLKRNAKEFDTMLDRLFFVKDSGISVPLAIIKINDEFTHIHNIGKKDILIVRPSCTKTLQPYSKTIINDGDVIINNRRNIPISFEDNGIEYDQLKLIDKTFSFQPTKINTIENFNIKMVERIVNNETDELNQTTELLKTKPIPNKTTFDDVGGLDSVIDRLKKEIVYPVKFPYAYKNKKVNHGFLFSGPPGTGKTHLANALSNEVNGKFISLNGLEMSDQFVGQTEKNWRKLFEEAKANGPSIIFIDEIDAVARKRTGRDVHGDKVVNQLLTLIGDVNTKNENLFIIGATNLVEMLDPAIIRPGRLSKIIEINPPDKNGLEQIFNIKTKNITLDENLDKQGLLKVFSDRKFTGADIEEIIGDAHNKSWERYGIYEKMENETLCDEDIKDVIVTQEDFDKALKNYRPEITKNKIKPIGFKK